MAKFAGQAERSGYGQVAQHPRRDEPNDYEALLFDALINRQNTMRLSLTTLALSCLLTCLPSYGWCQSADDYACGESAPPKQAQPIRVLRRVRILTPNRSKRTRPQPSLISSTTNDKAPATEEVAKRPIGQTLSRRLMLANFEDASSTSGNQTSGKSSKLVMHSDYVVEIVDDKQDSHEVGVASASGRRANSAHNSGSKTVATNRRSKTVRLASFDDPVEVPPIDESTVFDDPEQQDDVTDEKPTTDKHEQPQEVQEKESKKEVSSKNSKKPTKRTKDSSVSREARIPAHADVSLSNRQKGASKQPSKKNVTKSDRDRKTIAKSDRTDAPDTNTTLAPRLRRQRDQESQVRPETKRTVDVIRDPAASPELWEPIDPVVGKKPRQKLSAPRTIDSLVAYSQPDSASEKSEQLSKRLAKISEQRAAGRDQRQLSQEELLELVRRKRQRRWPWQR